MYSNIRPPLNLMGSKETAKSINTDDQSERHQSEYDQGIAQEINASK